MNENFMQNECIEKWTIENLIQIFLQITNIMYMKIMYAIAI